MSFTDCALAADRISCDAMIGLASAQARDNIARLDYLVNHPVCDRFMNLADRGIEHDLQKNHIYMLSRNLCVYKTKKYGEGDWTEAMQPLAPPVKVKFDEWTKTK